MKIRSMAFVLATLVTTSLLSVPAAAAVLVRATCGAVLTTNAYLGADLHCSGDGLTLAGNITVNLRGHRLVGSGGTALTVAGPYSPNVVNGRIEHWGSGIKVVRSMDDEDQSEQNVKISHVTFADNQSGVDATSSGPYFNPTTKFVISHSRFLRNTSGIGGFFTGGIDVTWSDFQHNGSAAKIDTGGLRIRWSRLQHNDLGVGCTEAGCTLQGDRLKDNTVGVSTRTFGADLTDNTISGGDVGYTSFGAFGAGDLTGNTFTHLKTGVDLSSSFAILKKNVFVKNGVGFSANGEVAPDLAATLERNLFLHNHDGIVVTDNGANLGTSLKANRAIKNRRWGIYAPGSQDLGGNQAYGNGHSPQCVGVVCHP